MILSLIKLQHTYIAVAELSEADIEVHLRLRAIPADGGIRDRCEVPNDGLGRELKLEGRDECVEHDLFHNILEVRKHTRRRKDSAHSSRVERT